MSQERLELTTPVLEQAKQFCALYRTVTVIGQ
jgi:hypothetical protein